MVLISLVKTLLNILYPSRCCFCGELLLPLTRDVPGFPWADGEVLGEIVCERCMLELPWLKMSFGKDDSAVSGEYAGKVDLNSDENSAGGDSCSFGAFFNPAFSGCCALGAYQGEFRRVLHRFKYGGKKFLAEPLGKLLSLKLLYMPWISSVDLVVPVPLAAEHFATRGYNQSFLLASVISRELNLPLQELLVRGRGDMSQTSLSRSERKKNVRGAFSCDVRGTGGGKGHVLLVDDILTSGATAHEASFTLKDWGSDRVSVAVVAR